MPTLNPFAMSELTFSTIGVRVQVSMKESKVNENTCVHVRALHLRVRIRSDDFLRLNGESFLN